MEKPKMEEGYAGAEGEKRSFIGVSLSSKDLYLLAKAMNEAFEDWVSCLKAPLCGAFVFLGVIPA